MSPKAKASAGGPLSYEPQLATLVAEPPNGDDWLHEQKFDGYRIGVRKEKETVTLWSRRNLDWTAEFASVAVAGAELDARAALLDGEVGVLLPSGVTTFQGLQNRRPGTALVYFAFDLMHLDGRDLRELPIEERKRQLQDLLGRGGEGAIRFSDHVVGGGTAFFQGACELGLEGMVSKRLGTKYRAGRNMDWLKTKCLHRQEFVIGGFTDPEKSRDIPSVLAAVRVVKPETVIRWHRSLGRLLWRIRSRGPVGRPPIGVETKELIRRMWKDNPLWGENRIAGELAKPGHRVSSRTVARYRPGNLPCGRGQKWSTSLRNHLAQTWACDWLTINDHFL